MGRKNSNAGVKRNRNTTPSKGGAAQRPARLAGQLSTGARGLTKASKMTPKASGRRPKRSVNR